MSKHGYSVTQNYKIKWEKNREIVSQAYFLLNSKTQMVVWETLSLKKLKNEIWENGMTLGCVNAWMDEWMDELLEPWPPTYSRNSPIVSAQKLMKNLFY